MIPTIPPLSATAAARFPASRRHLLERCDSTNDVGRDLLRDGAPDGTLVLADAQDAGRGRLARSWHSPPARNIHLSLLLRPAIPPERVPLLTLVLATAGHDALRSVGVAAVGKWPNDLVVVHGRGRRKIAGIACEAVSVTRGELAVVAGIGINVDITAEELPTELRPIATSVRIETGERADRGVLIATLLEQFAPLYEQLQHDGPVALLQGWQERLETLGRDVDVDVGDRVIRGRAVGLGPLGELRVRTADARIETITAGDVGME